MPEPLHDNPHIYPTLPARDSEGVDFDFFADEGSAFRTCWEYVLTHELTEAEGAAFWTAANLVHAALTPTPTANGDAS